MDLLLILKVGKQISRNVASPRDTLSYGGSRRLLQKKTAERAKPLE